MKTLFLLMLMVVSGSLFACRSNQGQGIEPGIPIKDNMRVRITVGQKALTATLYDNPTSRDFVSLLPLTMTLTDYNNTEKISDLPRRLTTKDAPAGYKPAPGDITVYAPWGNLALFYKEFPYSNGLIVLGKLDGDVDVFSKAGSVDVRFELVK